MGWSLAPAEEPMYIKQTGSHDLLVMWKNSLVAMVMVMPIVMKMTVMMQLMLVTGAPVSGDRDNDEFSLSPHALGSEWYK